MKISIQTNFPDIKRQLDQLQKDVANRAMASALNKTVAQGKTAMSREIRAEFNISASKVNESLRISKARASGGRLSFQASLYSPATKGRSLNLVNFAARQTSKGVTIKVKRGGARKLIPGAFLGNQGSTMFIRVASTTMASRSKYSGTKHAEKIKPMQTINVAQMFNTKRINSKVLRVIEDKLPAIFANEAKFFTDRFNAGK